MKASSSYHDLKGSIEADVSYAVSKRPGDPELSDASDTLKFGIDTKRYKIAGIHLWSSGHGEGEYDTLDVNFIVIDRNAKDGDNTKKIRRTISTKHFFQLFEMLDLYLFHSWFKNTDIHIDNIPEAETMD